MNAFKLFFFFFHVQANTLSFRIGASLESSVAFLFAGKKNSDLENNFPNARRLVLLVLKPSTRPGNAVKRNSKHGQQH